MIDVWERIRPKLESDPVELATRLARMHGPTLTRPPRAWCLAIRSVDRRIDRALGYPDKHGGRFGEHEVLLEPKLLRMLCRPVTIPRFGATASEVAALVGRRDTDLAAARVKGTFSVRHVEGLGGYWGKPTPIISNGGRELDPSVRGMEMPDRVWGWTAIYSDSWARDDFHQVVLRVPRFFDRTRRYRDKTDLHPEHPDVAGRVDQLDRRTRKYYKLPPPQHDAVWYKWKGDQFIGYDWRAAQTNPLIRENYQKHQRLKARRREWARRRVRPSRAKGSMEFRGWQWLCPACGRRVERLFLPMAFDNVLGGLLGEVIERQLARTPPPPPPARRTGAPRGFACATCHRVQTFSRVSPGFWNNVIAYLSGGLLYGSEVPRPAWVTRERQRAYVPKINARPAWRREQVRELMLRGWTYPRIAAELGITRVRVANCAHQIFKQHGVHGREQWARQVGVTLSHDGAATKLGSGAEVERESPRKKRTPHEQPFSRPACGAR
jgi:hypothetical protein